MEKEKLRERNCMTGIVDSIFLIDTNILVYAFDTTDPQKQKIAKDLLERCWKKEITYAISAQNLAEFFVVVVERIPGKMPLEQAEQIVHDISSFSHWKILYYNAETIQKAIEQYKKTKKHFWDALLVATMLENSITFLYTENITDFEKVNGITAINPLI